MTIPVPLIPRAHLFGNPARNWAQISPDGAYLSWLAPVEGVLNVWVCPTADVLDGARPVTDDRNRGIRFYGWTYDGTHLVYAQDANGDENFHIYAVDPATRTTRDLTPFPDVQASIAGVSRVVRDTVLVRMNQRDRRYFDLYALHLGTGALSMLAENTEGFAGFIADERHRVRFATRLGTDGVLHLLRRSGDDGWQDWLRWEAEDARASGPSGLNRAATALFLRDSRERDTSALVRLDLQTGDMCVLAADPRADIGATLSDAETGEPLACAVTVERTEYVAIDPRVQPDLDFLAGQDIGEWSMQSRTEDDRTWIIGAASDTVPASTYSYNRPARTLTKLYDARPDLAQAALSPMRSVIIRSRDGFDLVSYLTRPLDADSPGPMVLLVHGGPWGRDGFGFNPHHQWLANRGYAVLSVNFRGSTGFGKSFVNAGDGEWGRRMDDDLLDAVSWAVAEGFADPARVAIMGGSYGGYAVLAAMTRNPEFYACGVDIVGPSNLETLIATIPPYWEAIRAQLTRAVGDPGTSAGLALMQERSPVNQAGRIRRPLLIAQGANDPRVKQAESNQMVAAMKAGGVPVAYVLFPDEGHGFARPENNLAFNAAVEAFLQRHLGGRAEPPAPGEMEASTMQIVEGGDMLGL